MYTFTRGDLSAHFTCEYVEEWHAYLSADLPVWADGNDSGLCCHSCLVVAVDKI